MNHHPSIPPPQRHYWDISPSELGQLVAPAPKNILIVYYVDPLEGHKLANPKIQKFFDLTKECLACHNPDKTIIPGWRSGAIDCREAALNAALWFSGHIPAGDVFFVTATYGNWRLTEALALLLRATTLHIHNGTTSAYRAANGIPDGRYNPDDSTRRMAVIVDLDGTLLNSDHRSPYDRDAESLSRDRIVQPISGIIAHYAYDEGHDILVVTAREGDPKVQEATQRRLSDASIPYTQIFFRTPGDYRPDAAVKLEIFQKEIAPRWYVGLVIDDRPSVVRMWDALGLYVLQARPTKGEF